MHRRQPVVSIIICTHNRADDLLKTLAAIVQVCVPEQMPTELIVVDNASTDATAEVVASCRLPHMSLRYIHEPRRGKGYAYNTGMAAAQGKVFLFTDDDVRPTKNWIAGMCAPILSGRAEAVLGSIKIPCHLEQHWMEPQHRAWLASTEGLDAADPPALVGANMAFSREVLAKVPAFDVELGPGALGFGDETLFSYQLKQSGFRLTSAFEAQVEHHFDPSRLTRAAFINRSISQGRSEAYIMHHWRHVEIPLVRLFLIKRLIRLRYYRAKRSSECAKMEGIPVWEMQLISSIALYRQFLNERQKPRKYDRYGLIKHRYPEDMQ